MPYIFLLLVGHAAMAGKHPDCPAAAEITEDSIEPTFLRKYLDDNPKIDDPGKFICCLPQSIRGNFIVAHNSDAAQSGNPHGPRVVLFPKDRSSNRQQKFKFAISINGGGVELNNPLNAELISRKESSGELEAFDISFADKHVEMTRNPQECLNCHGSETGDLSRGLHLNFQPFAAWSRFLGGKIPCPGAETDYYKAITAVSKRALQTNPRYRCLDLESPIAKSNFKDLGDGRFAEGVVDFDLQADRVNNERTARFFRDTPDYERFKYAIVGSLLCIDPTIERKGVKDDWNRWLPPQVIKNLDDTSHLLEAVAASKDLRGTFRAQRQMRSNEHVKVDALLKKDIAKLEQGGNPQFRLAPLQQNCLLDEDRIVAGTATLPALSGIPTYDRFILDSAVRNANGLQPQVRYLFEARGISLANIDMDPTGGQYGRALDISSVANALVDLERVDSPLRKLRQIDGRPTTDFSFERLPQTCKTLERLSKNALAAAPGKEAKAPATSATTAH